jgi:hypothetical protein
MEEQNEKKELTKKDKPTFPKRKGESNRIVVLGIHSSTGTNTEELESKYSEKFGCKVIVLENNLKLVDIIDG